MDTLQFWNGIWNGTKVEDYKKYINEKKQDAFIKIFKENGIKKVCDAACGFGKYSVLCAKNNFETGGFDLAKDSVEITKAMLKEFKLPSEEYKTCGITNIEFEDSTFDGVVAHAVIDHVSYKDAQKAIDELSRITKSKGLIYVSFDGVEEDDMKLPHITLKDGSFEYTEGKRKGMLFRYYKDYEIKNLFNEYSIEYFNTLNNGERQIIVRNR